VPTHILETDPLVVILKVPYALVQPTTEEHLNGPSDGREGSEYACDDVGLGEHGDGIDQACGAGCCEEGPWGGLLDDDGDDDDDERRMRARPKVMTYKGFR
jgi:hypothetical protein